MRRRNSKGRFISNDNDETNENELFKVQNVKIIKFFFMILIVFFFISPWLFIFLKKNMLYNMGNYIQNFFEQSFSTCSCPLESKTDNSILKDI